MTTTQLPRVILVDDEPNVIEGLTRRLRRDYQIFSAQDGAQALRLLEQEGEMHVIISDMRMPNMNGAQLLAEVRKWYPDMVRILLTGQADLESAIHAVNEGQIFRFLAKPCPADIVKNVLQAAMRQHELVTAERVLLDKTLRGALHALSEVLALAMPEAFGKATRIRTHAAAVAKAVGLEDAWRIEAAASLSQVGAVTLSPAVASKLYHGARLTPEEQAAVARLPTFAIELLSTIPRLEPLCDLIAVGFAGEPNKVPASTEAQILKLCAQFDALSTTMKSGAEAAARLQADSRGYDPQVLQAFFAIINAEEQGGSLHEIGVSELRDGMVLAEDLYSSTGTLLLARGQRVRGNVIARLQAMKSTLGNKQVVKVRLQDN
ncbi:MAG TPA: response regulator [Polyangiales bacterium]|nr:response regulator [Polyangiales bacterium]